MMFVSSPGKAYETAMLSTQVRRVFDTNITLYPARKIEFDYVCQTNGTRDFTSPDVLRGTKTLSMADNGLNFVPPKVKWTKDLGLDQIQNKFSFRCSYGGKKGNGFYDAGAVDFDSITEAPERGYSMQRKPCAVGHVYVVKTYDGYYAKLIVKSD